MEGPKNNQLSDRPLLPDEQDSVAYLEVRVAQFTHVVNKMCRKLNIESGAGRLVCERVLHSSSVANELVQNAVTVRNKAKSKKLIREALQQVHKVVHWLDQLERSGNLAVQAAESCRSAAGTVAQDLAHMLNIDAGKVPLEPEGLSDDLSEL